MSTLFLFILDLFELFIESCLKIGSVILELNSKLHRRSVARFLCVLAVVMCDKGDDVLEDGGSHTRVQVEVLDGRRKEERSVIGLRRGFSIEKPTRIILPVELFLINNLLAPVSLCFFSLAIPIPRSSHS